jgi:hypothetical protein
MRASDHRQLAISARRRLAVENADRLYWSRARLYIRMMANRHDIAHISRLHACRV